MGAVSEAALTCVFTVGDVGQIWVAAIVLRTPCVPRPCCHLYTNWTLCLAAISWQPQRRYGVALLGSSCQARQVRPCVGQHRYCRQQ